MSYPVVKVVVACEGLDGRDLFFVKVECTQEQYDRITTEDHNNEHFDIARDWVRENFEVAGPYWECDEFDPCANALMGIFEWDTASVISDGKI